MGYVHEEIAAEPYIHDEPALTPEALGEVDPGRRQAQQFAPSTPVQQFAPQQFAQQPAQQFAPQQIAQPAQQFAPQQIAQPAQQFNQQFAAPSGPAGWAGYCINNLGEGVPCRQQF